MNDKNDEFNDNRYKNKVEFENKNSGGFLSSILNNVVFYGLDKMMTSQKVSKKPKFYSKSPFLTVSESVAAQIIADTKPAVLTSDDSRQVNRPTKRAIDKFDYDRTINDLREDIDILDVTIEDLKHNSMSSKDEQDLKKLIRSRTKLQESLEEIQIEAVNELIED